MHLIVFVPLKTKACPLQTKELVQKIIYFKVNNSGQSFETQYAQCIPIQNI